MKSAPSLVCRGLGCTSTRLVEAHIIPRAFGRLVRGSRPNYQLIVDQKKVREAVPQLGEYDPNILCACCDNKLGRYDEYAIEVCRDLKGRKVPNDDKEWFESNIDVARFSLFVLAVLWRASISARPMFECVDLGAYEAEARDVLFGAVPLESLDAFQVMVNRFIGDKLDPTDFYTYPKHACWEGMDLYIFSAGGFKIMAKMRAKSFPPDFDPLVINRTGIFRGALIKIEETGEFEAMTDVLRPDLRGS